MRVMKPMIFQNYGGIHQLRIESAEDLACIHDLHPAHWAATSVQVESLQCDPVFLEYLNQDGSGTIRAEHLRAAVRWIFRMMAKDDRLAASSDVLCLADLDTSHEEAGSSRKPRSMSWDNCRRRARTRSAWNRCAPFEIRTG